MNKDPDYFCWRICTSGNPNKSWIMDSDGKNKLSPLMSTKAAQDICYAHNMTVGYLLAHIPEESK